MMANSVKLNKKHIILLVALVLFITKFLDYSRWDETLGGQIGYFIYFGIFVFAYRMRKKLNGFNNPFTFELAVFAITPFLTYISQMLIYGGSLAYIKSYVYCFIVAIFYLFYVSKVKEEEIVKAFSVVALCIASIQIIQQLIPSIALFGLGDTTKDLEIRNGLLRYRFSAIFYTSFALFYYWNKFINKRNLFFLVLFLLFALSDYLYLTRQYIAGMAVALLFSVFFIKDKTSKRLALLMIILIAYLIFENSDSLLSYFIESSKKDATDENIRVFAYQFYGEKILSSPLAFLFGNGFPQEQRIWQENMSLYVADIGIVGQVFTHGIFWEIAYFTAIYKILWKYRKFVPLYIKLFALSGLVHCSMVASYGGPSTLLTWLSILYIATLNINKKKNEERICQRQKS